MTGEAYGICLRQRATTRRVIHPHRNREIVMGAEGVALAPAGANGGYVIVSSQGDNAYAVYKLPVTRHVGRFHINDGTVDSVQETDGIELMLGDFGPDFPGGLFVVQDGDNQPEIQNFKILSWSDVIAALKLGDK